MNLSSEVGAGAWLMAAPVDDARKCTPIAFRMMLRRRLRIRVLDREHNCPYCDEIMDTYGDHALSCTGGPHRNRRHNKIRDNLFRDFKLTNMVTMKEKRGLLDGSRPPQEKQPEEEGEGDGEDDKLDESGRRPGDIWIQDLAGLGQAALDMAVTNGLGRDSLEISAGQKGVRLRWYEDYKRNYRGSANRPDQTTEILCRERGLLFVPMIFEAHGGGFGSAMREVLGHLAEGIANRWNKCPEAVVRRTAQRISFLIHSENAQAVLDRMNANLIIDQETPLVL